MKKTRANSLNSKFKLWVWDNFIKNNFKKNKVQSLTNLMLKYEIKIKKNIIHVNNITWGGEQ
jgi:hypothetical protein